MSRARARAVGGCASRATPTAAPTPMPRRPVLARLARAAAGPCRRSPASAEARPGDRRRRAQRALGGGAGQAARPGRDVVVLEAGELAGAASGRNGGFIVSSLTHGVDNGAGALSRGDADARAPRAGELRGPCAEIERLGIDCDLERSGDLDVAVEAHELEWLAEERRGAGPARPRGRAARPRAGARRRSTRRLFGAGCGERTGAALGRPGAPRLGPGRAAERARRPDPRADRGAAAAHGERRRSAWPPTRAALRRAPGAARDQRLPGPDRRDPPPGRPGLGLRPRHRAAERRAAPARSAGEAARGSATSRTASTTPADRRRARSSGAASTRSITTAAGIGARAGAARAQLRRRSPATSSPPSRSSRGCASATAGAARSTPAAASSPSTAPRSAAGSPTRSATPGSGSAPAASAPRSRSTCSTAARPRRRGCGRSARSRCRFRPSRCAGRRSS